MTIMTNSETRIEEFMSWDRERYDGNPYHYVEWTRKPGPKFYGWAKKEKFETLDWIPEMARAIQDEAYEYNMLFDAGVWKPEPYVETTFDSLLRRHQELATLRRKLNDMDREAATEQSNLQQKMVQENQRQWFELVANSNATKRVYDYSN